MRGAKQIEVSQAEENQLHREPHEVGHAGKRKNDGRGADPKGPGEEKKFDADLLPLEIRSAKIAQRRPQSLHKSTPSLRGRILAVYFRFQG